MMIIVAVDKLSALWSKHPRVKSALESWVIIVKECKWQKPQDIKERFASVDFLHDNRVVFNIKGNQFRIIARIQYRLGIVEIRFAGTHAEYDRTDAETI